MLSFLNELDTPHIPSIPITHPTPRPPKPASPSPPKPSATSKPHQTIASTTSKPSTLPPSHAITEESIDASTSHWGGWGVLSSNLWSQAQAVTSLTTTSIQNSLTQAKLLAEHQIKPENISKLGYDLSRMGHQIVDTIAPVVFMGNATTQDGNVYGDMVVWMCLQFEHDLLVVDAVTGLIREGFVEGRSVCGKLILNDVVDPEPKMCLTIEQGLMNVKVLDAYTLVFFSFIL